jgi:hypothetical protein
MCTAVRSSAAPAADHKQVTQLQRELRQHLVLLLLLPLLLPFVCANQVQPQPGAQPV